MTDWIEVDDEAVTCVRLTAPLGKALDCAFSLTVGAPLSAKNFGQV